MTTQAKATTLTALGDDPSSVAVNDAALNNLALAIAPGQPLPVPPRKQFRDRLCWAAAAQMVLRYRKFSEVKQCQLADVKFKNLKQPQQTPCCDQKPLPFLSNCDHGVDEDEVVPIYDADPFHVQATFVPQFLTFEQLEDALYPKQPDKQAPVQVGILWNSSNPNEKHGHMVLVIGCYRDAAGTPWVFVNDPLLDQTQPGQVRYDDLKDNYKNGLASPGQWACSWFGF